jgi:outer membrane autotransporter protein
MQARLDLSDSRFGTAEERPLRFYVSGNFVKGDRSATLTSLDYDLDVGGVSAGAEYDGGGFVLGGAVNLTRSRAEMTGAGETEVDAVQAGLYAGWSGGGAFAQAHAGLGWLDFEVRRQAVIDEISASPEGKTVTAGAKAGYLLGLGNLSVGPVIGVHYAKLDIDDYVESGDPVLTLSVGEQETSTLLGSAGIEARGTFEAGGAQIQPFFTAAVEREFKGDARMIRYAGTASPTIVNSWQIPERSDETYGRLAGGFSLRILESLSVQLEGSVSVEREQGNDKAGSVALRLGF